MPERGPPPAPGRAQRVTVQAQPLPRERAAHIFDDARLYPIRFAGADAVDFVPMSYQSYRQSTFLDRRIRPAAPEVYRGALADIEALSADAGAAGEVGYIFHSAYCCSTLLASALALLPRMLVLKEPVTLLQVAMGIAPRSRLPLTHALLARRNDAGDRVVVKASSNCSVIGADLLQLARTARALFLYSDLWSFVLAVLKDPNRSGRMRETLANPEAFEALGVWWPAGEPLPDLAALDDAGLAAWVWIGRLRAFARLRQIAGSDRIAVLDGALVASAPAEALPAAAGALGIAVNPVDLAAVLASGLWQRHAKSPEIAFDPRAREREITELAASHRPAAESAIAFARRLLDAGREATWDGPRMASGLAL